MWNRQVAQPSAKLIRAAVAHQLRRPVLARLLDFEEARLLFDANIQHVKTRFAAIILNLLSRPDLPRHPDPDLEARDVTAVIKGMVDAAGERGETDQHQLTLCVERAVFGYLIPTRLNIDTRTVPMGD